ncbi:hypothetical protein N7G274_007851 [Stereocaulon virgatum]|uniref:Ubiquitin carboxyl-terminal hydrolase n=1 Tax=Stereocaulon virgatum TaxID=373712 RepID=A0ABR4A258_9LECA
MTERSRRKRAGNKSNDIPYQKVFTSEPSAPANAEDKRLWKGFCEIESEPAFFNVMLKRFGVQGVKVQEVVSLDDELLVFLPRPVYGLIFLFKWIEEDPDKQEQSCPEGVWFANQTINNACASVALLNIVNNIPSIELGDNLRAFKDFTSNFTPALRGDAIANFDFVKQVHNSFARKMDLLNGDLLLKNEATSKGKGKKGKTEDDENEAGFHFIAFVPIENQLWKLDGLERQPVCLGPIAGDWLGQAKPEIEARMAQYEEGQIEFAILSLVRDPLLNHVSSLAQNIKSIAALSAQLDRVKPNWQDSTAGPTNGHICEPEGLLSCPDLGYHLTQKEINQAKLPEKVVNLCLSNMASVMIEHRQELLTNQAELRMSIKEEMQSNVLDEERAAARSCDYGASMQGFVRKLRLKKQAEQAAKASQVERDEEDKVDDLALHSVTMN